MSINADNNSNKDLQEPHNPVKSEFYTREGLWKSIQHCEYSKQLNSQLNLNPTSSFVNSNLIQQPQIIPQVNNEPVRISFVSVFNSNKDSSTVKCENCSKQTNINFELKCNFCNNQMKIYNCVDYLIFNYAKELYIYTYNGIKQPNEKKQLIEKKMYKALSVTCHDINRDACKSNSVLIAAGFSKGEIHVFDVFKKDSSLFFNNNSNDKLNDRTKATCIKWVPKTTNLFLVSHTSGNIYLYDINLNQNQVSVQSQQSNNQSTVFQLINEGDCFKIEKNVGISKNTKTQNENMNGLTGSTKLTNQTLTQNPLTKWSIMSTNKNPCSINEFVFSPDGQYLAIACQDGYLRVFNYNELQLKCIMKSYFGGLLCVCWSHDGKYIATGGEDDLITIYSFNDMRVACRGRGHCSWVNCVQFDYWTSDINADTFNGDNDQDSDFEDYHTNNNNNNKKTYDTKDTSKCTKKNLNSKQHTNKRLSSLSDYDHLLLNKTNIYRLGSVGQDNQIAFWDLSEDILKEKTYSRSRVTSIALTSLSIAPTSSPPQLQTQKQDLHQQQQQQQQQQKEKQNKHNKNEEGGFLRKHKRSILNKTSGVSSLSTIKTTLINQNKNESLIEPNVNIQQQPQQQVQLQRLSNRLNISNICPKLDEVPIVEPLICKRIANERINSILFKEDSFLISSQDGVISTWARPDKLSTNDCLNNNSLSGSNDKLQHSTFL